MTIIMSPLFGQPYICSYETLYNSFCGSHHVGQTPLAGHRICGQLWLYSKGALREQGQAPIALQRQMLSRQTIGETAKRPGQESLWGTTIKNGDPTPGFLSVLVGFWSRYPFSGVSRQEFLSISRNPFPIVHFRHFPSPRSGLNNFPVHIQTL